MTEAALAGITVIELGEQVSAPYCARLFADFGADVIKVEQPAGDIARQMGPFPGDIAHPEKSGLYFINNVNKRGVTCDVAVETGRELFLDLLRRADILIENHLPQQMRSWGLDFDTIHAVNPGLVMLSITPFGQSGPYSGWRGCDLNAFHLSGAGFHYCGLPGEAPLQHGTFSADYFGAVTAASWGMGAFLGRDALGGQQVDVSCAEAIAAVFTGAQIIGGCAQNGQSPSRSGVGLPYGAPATIVPCRDGHVWMLALEPGQWRGLKTVLGDPAWARAEEFDDMAGRARHAHLIYPQLEKWALQHDKMDIMEKCQAAGCPVSAVYTVAEAAAQPHLRARHCFEEFDHPALGKLKIPGAPFKLSHNARVALRPAPLLGQHNEAVYAGKLGLPASRLRALNRAGTI